jgi:3-methyladenine DNA glycosylase AlkD
MVALVMRGLSSIRKQLRAQGDPERAALMRRFFKTAPGEYGEGDRFLGLAVPQVRAVARECRGLPMAAVRALLRSPWHEERLLALVILVERFRRGAAEERAAIHRFYLGHTRWIDNWDLVDVSAKDIVGGYLEPGDAGLLERLARSKSLWERRIAVLATFSWIARGVHAPSLALARRLIDDPHDLIHKAVGWMLREVWNRDPRVAEEFLRAHCRRMPRTMLRYAIEKMPPARRRHFLAGTA